MLNCGIKQKQTRGHHKNDSCEMQCNRFWFFHPPTRSASLSFSNMATIRNALSVSAVTATRWVRNLRSKSSIFWSNLGPSCWEVVLLFLQRRRTQCTASWSPCHVEWLYDEANSECVPPSLTTQLCLSESDSWLLHHTLSRCPCLVSSPCRRCKLISWLSSMSLSMEATLHISRPQSKCYLEIHRA